MRLLVKVDEQIQSFNRTQDLAIGYCSEASYQVITHCLFTLNQCNIKTKIVRVSLKYT